VAHVVSPQLPALMDACNGYHLHAADGWITTAGFMTAAKRAGLTLSRAEYLVSRGVAGVGCGGLQHVGGMHAWWAVACRRGGQERVCYSTSVFVFGRKPPPPRALTASGLCT
jgi:hypothetical protein